MKGRGALYASIMLSLVLFQYSNNLVEETKEFDLSKIFCIYYLASEEVCVVKTHTCIVMARISDDPKFDT